MMYFANLSDIYYNNKVVHTNGQIYISYVSTTESHGV